MVLMLEAMFGMIAPAASHQGVLDQILSLLFPPDLRLNDEFQNTVHYVRSSMFQNSR
jgi:hypothetical protein